MVELSQFCDPEHHSRASQGPYRAKIRGMIWSVATDGYMFVASRPPLAAYPREDELFSTIAKYVFSKPRAEVVAHDLAIWAGPHEVVRDCDCATCENCDNDRFVDCQCLTCHDFHLRPCPDCEGPCPDCGDSGQVIPKERRAAIFGFPLNQNLLAKALRAFPKYAVLKVSVSQCGQALRLDAEEIWAIVMGMRWLDPLDLPAPRRFPEDVEDSK